MRSFVRYLKAVRWPKAGLRVMADRAPQRNPQPRWSLMAKKVRCEV